MATVQEKDDGVIPMTSEENNDLIMNGITYDDMTPAQRRSWDKMVRLYTEQRSAERDELYEKHFGKIDPHAPRPKNAKEMMEMLRPKYEEGSEMDLLFKAIAKGESAVESVRRVRDPCY